MLALGVDATGDGAALLKQRVAFRKIA